MRVAAFQQFFWFTLFFFYFIWTIANLQRAFLNLFIFFFSRFVIRWNSLIFIATIVNSFVIVIYFFWIWTLVICYIRRNAHKKISLWNIIGYIYFFVFFYTIPLFIICRTIYWHRIQIFILTQIFRTFRHKTNFFCKFTFCWNIFHFI